MASIVLAACFVNPVDAASRACRQLEASLQGSGGAAGLARKYDKAIARQAEALNRARADARSASCGLSLFGGRCKALKATVKRMSDNLATLQNERDRLGKGISKRERSRILASLEAQGCRASAQRKDKPDRARDVEARVPDNRPGGVLKLLDPRVQAATPHSPPSGGLAFCVRTCDGYIYPMTRFGDPRMEQKACEAACPRTDVALYHRGSQTRIADMRSAATGARYADLPAAFQFRNAAAPTPESCGCKFADGEAERGADRPIGLESATASFDKRLFGAAPVKAPEIKQLPPAEPRDLPVERTDVRVVGPKFLPDPAAAATPPVPDPTRGR